MRAANGEKFSRLWSGDTSAYATANNDGHSEADLALCSLLAFWCGPDEVRIDRLFRQSGLCREKWTRRADYRSLTLSVALDRDEFWGGDRAKITIYARREGAVRRG
jgi:putative DNA primase/helicase